MVAEENKSALADTDSEEPSSGTSSSSESDEEVHCLMADDIDKCFEEFKAENESCASKYELSLMNKRPEKETVENKKKEKVAVTKKTVDGCQAGPTMSESKTSSDEDRPILLNNLHNTTYGGGMVFAPIEIHEVNWATHFLPKIDLAAKGKQKLEAFARPNPVEEHYLLVIQAAWEDVSRKMSEFDEWARFKTEEEEEQPPKAEEKKILAIEHKAQEQPAQDEETAMSEQHAQDHVEELSLVVQNVEEAEAVDFVDHQAHEEEENQAHEEEQQAQEEEQPVQDVERQAQACSSQSSPSNSSFSVHYSAFVGNIMDRQDPVSSGLDMALETSLVRQFTESQHQIASDMDFFKLQQEELVNHFKEIIDAKKEEQVWYQSRPLLVRCGSGTNQAEAGGHVRSGAQRGRGVITGAKRLSLRPSKLLTRLIGTQNGDLPADAPLCPVGLPIEPAMANTDQGSPKTGKKTRSNLSTKSTHKTAIHKHAIFQVMICMRVPKNIGSRPTTQLENQRSLNTTHSQSSGGNHRSVIFRSNTQSTFIAQWSSGTTTQPATTSMIALDLSCATTQSADHNASSTRASIKSRLHMPDLETQISLESEDNEPVYSNRSSQRF
ncbi:hypothetical protein F511_31168 [Dorcoceras hygrometricum]|uniref:Uncharacterized protein n=1 Tax=Dorcoceras hygrometricum TaxID=472368 RepID=A0A2Z7APH7_9LAMI|nr:hypothetical protein F511_31168 [Dorcoceras hygrometricum]